MAQKIRHPKSRRDASWFDPAKYEGLENLDELSWYLQFAARRMLRLLIRNERQSKGELTQNCPAYALALQIFEKPLVDIPDLLQLPFGIGRLFMHHYAPALNPKVAPSTAVHLMTVMELYEQESLLGNNVVTNARSYFEEITPQGPDLDTMMDLRKAAISMGLRRTQHQFKDPLLLDLAEEMTGVEAHGRPYNRVFDVPLLEAQQIKPTWIPITVDLRFPDSILVRQFEKLLTDARSKIPRLKQARQKKNCGNYSTQREQWIRCHVLQFLDIQSWQLLTKGRSFNEAIWNQIEAAVEEQASSEKDKNRPSKDNSNYRKTNQVAAYKMIDVASVDFSLLEIKAAELFSARWAVFEESLFEIPVMKRILETLSRKDFLEELRLFYFKEASYRNPQELTQVHEDNFDVYRRNTSQSIRAAAHNRAVGSDPKSVN